MKTGLTIQPATTADIVNLASLRGGGTRLEQTMLGYLQGTYSPGFAEPERAVCVARVNDQFAGYIAGHRTTRFDCQGELQWLNVASSFRGQGIADALIRSLFVWFIFRSIHRVCVNVDPDNLIARKVYARHGAKELAPYWLVWSCLTDLPQNT